MFNVSCCPMKNEVSKARLEDSPTILISKHEVTLEGNEFSFDVTWKLVNQNTISLILEDS